MQRIYLNDSIINYPKINCTYHLRKNDNDNHETVTTFSGEALKHCASLDAATGLWSWRSGYRVNLILGKQCMLAPASLPSDPRHIERLPLLVYDNTLKRVGLTTSITINCRRRDIPPRYFLKYRLLGKPTAILVNEALQDECQRLVPDVKVNSGKYPIILENKLPEKTLHNLYRLFLNFNSDDKLKDQYQLTDNMCHARAHFIAELLYQYGIESTKLFKTWHLDDWKPFNSNSWSFHCGVMLVDANNQKWVWDPWVGFNHRLLSLSEWVNRPDEPKPKRVLICNRSVNNPSGNGHCVFGTRFSQLPKREFNAVQIMVSSAIPNPPEHPIKDESFRRLG